MTKLILAVTAPYANETVKTAISDWLDMVDRDDHTAFMTDTAERMYSEKYLKKNQKLFPIIAKFTEPLKKQKTFMTEFSNSVKNEKIIVITFRIVD